MLSLLLALLYPLAIQYRRGGVFQILLPITVFALLVDVIANYTELALLTWDFPHAREYTFSQRLMRLRFDFGWRGAVANRIIPLLNFFDPTGKHIE